MDLDSPITVLPFVGEKYGKRLAKLEIYKVRDLLLHVPHRYVDYRSISSFKGIEPGELVTIQGTVNSLKNQYTRAGKKMQIVEVTDGENKLSAVWFNQPYLIRNFKVGELVSLSGKFDWFGKKLSLVSPEYEKITDSNLIHTGRLVPIYPETAGLSSKWLRRRIYDAMKKGSGFNEYYSENILDEFGILEINTSIDKIHFPDNIEEAQNGRRRLAFDELLTLQVENLERKNSWREKEPTFVLSTATHELKKYYDSLGFNLTQSQKDAIREILKDLTGETPMNRMLEGDVGSGKTVVAGAGAAASYINGYQTIFMAPTQILARQHYNTLSKIFEPLGARVSLVTGKSKIKSMGRSDIIVGTHALIYQTDDFSQTALVVIDEQHRFGVEQRAFLSNKTSKNVKVPHVLTMTATPIPRTVALTLYGDLDLSILSEMPKGRIPVTTWIVHPEKRDGAYNWIGEQVRAEGVQAFVVCPLIEVSEAESMKQVRAVTTEYENIKKLYPDLKVGLLHGRMKAKDKDEALASFVSKSTNILVATPVVEVGIDIPNATIIAIEASERFGLAQLHQLRGRVGRGSKKSYCLLFTESKSGKSVQRLEALRKTKSGFELAEMDLSIRGPGEIFGTKQSGYAELKYATWQDVDLIKATKRLAKEVVSHPRKHKGIVTYLKEKQKAAN